MTKEDSLNRAQSLVGIQASNSDVSDKKAKSDDNLLSLAAGTDASVQAVTTHNEAPTIVEHLVSEVSPPVTPVRQIYGEKLKSYVSSMSTIKFLKPSSKHDIQSEESRRAKEELHKCLDMTKREDDFRQAFTPEAPLKVYNILKPKLNKICISNIK